MASIGCLFLLVASFIVTASCRHVHFPLHLTWEKGAPDGNLRDMIYVNGQFPGPELRLHYGDSVEVDILKKLIMVPHTDRDRSK